MLLYKWSRETACPSPAWRSWTARTADLLLALNPEPTLQASCTA
jgi:hypothetical protein